MEIRPYTDADDAALMALERQCPRGAPTPFVHWRRRFADRAALFGDYLILLAVEAGTIVGALAAGLKEARLRGVTRRLAYLFDARTAPTHRRRGIAAALLGAMIEQSAARGCAGAYGDIVATNGASLALFQRFGFEAQRRLHYLTFRPAPLPPGPTVAVRRWPAPALPEGRAYADHDLFSEQIHTSLLPFELTHWQSDAGATLSSYRQELIYQQVPYGAPWPSAEAIAGAGQHWRLLNPQGEATALRALFDVVRDRAAAAGVRQLSLLLDGEAATPRFFYEASDGPRDYLIVARSYGPDWDGTFGPRLYPDPREL